MRMLERAAAAKTTEERWNVYVKSLDSNFFTSPEARLQETSKVRKSKVAYQGLLVNENNCEDLKTMFPLGWEAKRALGQSLETYNQIRIAVGQFCRVCVSMKLCPAESLWKYSSICFLLCNLDAVTVFIGYFQIRSAAATVMGKALHLIRIAQYSISFFKKGNREKEIGQVETVAQFLRSIARSHKTECRRLSYFRKNMEDRNLCGKLLLPTDFRHMTSAAEEACEHMMENAKKCLSKRQYRKICLSTLSSGSDLLTNGA